MTHPKDKSKLFATRLAARDALIVARIQAGEKRYVLAEEFGLSDHTISRISIKAGLPRWSRFKRKPK